MADRNGKMDAYYSFGVFPGKPRENNLKSRVK